MKKVKAVIMAGGFGTRIQPLTHSIPKPMLPVVNVPMMENVLKQLVKVGIDEVVILLYYKPEIIKNHFKDGSDWGVKIHYVLPDADYGTAGAVGMAREYLDTTFMIVSGDLVTDFDFQKILHYHEKRESKLTITLTSVDNPLQFGVVIVNEEGKIEKFLEKPSWGEVFSDTINTGIYVIEPEILKYIPKGEPFDFAKDLFPLLMQEGIDLLGYTAHGYWRDVGNPESYREVHRDLFLEKVHFDIPGKVIEYPEGTLYLQGNSEIDKSVEIIDTVVIGDNVKIGKNSRLHNVTIGDNVTIGEECKLRNSILWHDITIGKKCVFDNAVICNDNIIEDMVTAKAGVILAEGCHVGKFVTFDQDVTVWPNKEIEPAAIVTNNVVWGTKYKNAIFQEGIIRGKANIEIDCEMSCKIAEAFASLLPEGSTIAIGRDFEDSSRMLKRSFDGGVLATGVNIEDLQVIPASVLRHYIQKNDNINAGAYFRKSIQDPTSVEILLYTSEGHRLNTETAKKVEKNYFKQDFRKVDYKEMGSLNDEASLHKNACGHYLEKIKELIDHKIIRGSNFQVVIDLMYGITKEIFPRILSELQIENILLNAYYDRLKLENITHYIKESQHEVAKIVTALEFQLGVLIYPHGQRLTLISDDGEILDRVDALIAVLRLMDIDAASNGKKYRVFLPSWAPDMMDSDFKYLEIDRGKYLNFKREDFKQYDLIATVDGNFAFTEFAYHRDGIYATLKIMELLSRHNILLSQIEKEVKHFFYKRCKIPCPQHKKGKMMRKFIEYAHDKPHSTLEGVKIWENDTDWVLMIPDQYTEDLNLFIQANNEEQGKKLHDSYANLIQEWLNE
ncbi:mannose-1-phosphate guanylyltransferase / phosphomannomutase [Nitratiruptor sp. YY08-26]|uniref:sugar phosphate nucleotidyltransferase n=1 Tax=unclassified Nitratiruptor TaxID=2624044 RepID=UPI0019163146|nr:MULTISPECIES: sugar phosphate nucleotidyltransferase [unclassified Nitratiruptor]BCD62259.1 mannose-1-phosphate guanylyltransferase / phosphomannomutase [Nitratiruptor sp. YY08-13]BCD66195.1 mannose-1-phosphate guanylyltransferase / phosphomannomutase [Nitratiruptor sp. YY08-26]